MGFRPSSYYFISSLLFSLLPFLLLSGRLEIFVFLSSRPRFCFHAAVFYACLPISPRLMAQIIIPHSAFLRLLIFPAAIHGPDFYFTRRFSTSAYLPCRDPRPRLLFHTPIFYACSTPAPRPMAQILISRSAFLRLPATCAASQGPDFYFTRRFSTPDCLLRRVPWPPRLLLSHFLTAVRSDAPRPPSVSPSLWRSS